MQRRQRQHASRYSSSIPNSIVHLYRSSSLTVTNPFIYDLPVPSTDLVDRAQEVDQLLNLAIGSHNSRLQGPRRYGKTSLLFKVLEEAEKQGFKTVYVDFLLASTQQEVIRRLHEAYAASLTGKLSQIVARLTRSWRGRAKLAPGGVGGELEYQPSTDSMQKLADLLDLPREVARKTGQQTLVVFDEFQDFLSAEGKLEGLLRSKLQLHRDVASYIFSGSEQSILEEAFGKRTRSLYDQARPLYLAPLPDDELGDYIYDRFQASARDIEQDTLDLLLGLVRGHPQRAMLIAHHLWEQTERETLADRAAFDRALTSVDRETNERFEGTWHSLSGAPNQRKVLTALALSEDTLYSKRTLADFKLNKGQAQSGEAGLIRAGEVRKVSGRSEIVDPLLERWIQQRLRREV